MKKNEHRNIIARVARIREATNSYIEQELSERGLKGIVPAHGVVFAYLFRQDEPITMTALVKETGRAKSTVTGIVKTLERHGYVYRQDSPEDARSVQIGLTKKGWTIKTDFEEISNLLLKRVYGDMVKKDMELLTELLSQIERNLKQ